MGMKTSPKTTKIMKINPKMIMKTNLKAKSQIWKICPTSSVMKASGPNVNQNQSIWARSNVKPTSACSTVWKVSWLKAIVKPSAKRTKRAYGDSIKNLEFVSNAATTAQR